MHLAPLVTASVLALPCLPPCLAIPARLVLKGKTSEPYGDHRSSGLRYAKPVCPPYTIPKQPEDARCWECCYPEGSSAAAGVKGHQDLQLQSVLDDAQVGIELDLELDLDPEDIRTLTLRLSTGENIDLPGICQSLRLGT